MPVKILFVCLGNICRSPTAEGVFLNYVAEKGWSRDVLVDSAGTASWHAGEPPDSRTIATAKKRHYDLSPLRARGVREDDFHEFDYILAMDLANLRDLKRIQPSDAKATLDLFLKFGNRPEFREVPDPYHGAAKDFELVLDLVEDASQGLLQYISVQHHLK